MRTNIQSENILFKVDVDKDQMIGDVWLSEQTLADVVSTGGLPGRKLVDYDFIFYKYFC